MMATLGVAIIGQAPRPDLASALLDALPPGTRLVLRGCLDGLADEEVDRLTPISGGDTLYTRLRGERDVKVSKSAVIARAPAVLSRLRAEGSDALLFACTGAFPSLPGDAGVVFPSQVLASLAAGLLQAGRLGLLVPAPEQIAGLSRKWERAGVEVVAEALVPSARPEEAERVALRLAERAPDLVAMDCMSYDANTKRIVRQTTRAPTLLAVSATARVLGELLA